MLISVIIISACFVALILIIITNKLNKAIAAIGFALVTFFTMIIFEDTTPTLFVTFLVGEPTEYVNLHSILLILGMLLIIQVCHEGGVFQFLAFKLIQMTGGKPSLMLFVLGFLSVIITAFVNNILSVFILIPLTVVASRILSIDPRPYIMVEGIVVKLGAVVFIISSVSNIIIATYATITFAEFFIYVGLYAWVLFGITAIFFHFYYRNKLMVPKKRLIEVFKSFNVWNYVPDRKLFMKCIITLAVVFVSFIVIPADIIPPDIVALTGGLVLVVISKLDGKDVVKRLDLELLLYIMCIFIITGALEELDFITAIGNGLQGISAGNVLLSIILVLWISAGLSSAVDNIPITKVLLPAIGIVTQGFPPMAMKSVFFGMAYGINLGDNLTPAGDTIVVLNVAEQNERPLNISEMAKIGFIAAIIHLVAITIYFTLIFEPVIGISILGFTGLIIGFLVFWRYLSKSFRKDETLIFSRVLRKLKNPRYRRQKKRIFLEFSRKFVQRNHITQRTSIIRSILKNCKRFIQELV